MAICQMPFAIIPHGQSGARVHLLIYPAANDNGTLFRVIWAETTLFGVISPINKAFIHISDASYYHPTQKFIILLFLLFSCVPPYPDCVGVCRIILYCVVCGVVLYCDCVEGMLANIRVLYFHHTLPARPGCDLAFGIWHLAFCHGEPKPINNKRNRSS